MNIIGTVLGVIAIVIILVLAIAAIFKNTDFKDNEYYEYLKNTVAKIVQNEQCEKLIFSIIKDVASEPNLTVNEFVGLVKAKILEAFITNSTFSDADVNYVSNLSPDELDNVIYQLLQKYGIIKRDYSVNVERIDKLTERYDLSSNLDKEEVLFDDNAEEIEMVDPGYDPEDCLTPEDDDFEGEDDVEEVEMGYDPEDGIIPDEEDEPDNINIAHFDVPETNDIISIIVPKDFKGTVSIKDENDNFIGGMGTLKQASNEDIIELGEGTPITEPEEVNLVSGDDGSPIE